MILEIEFIIFLCLCFCVKDFERFGDVFNSDYFIGVKDRLY